MIPIPILNLDNIIQIAVFSVVAGVFMFLLIAVLKFTADKIDDIIKTYQMYKNWNEYSQDKKDGGNVP